jgi:radical SAM superfamily enzyme YgiQ (UPF0313 family)
MDYNFISDIKWLRGFCKEYSRFVNLPFFCYGHPNNINSETGFLLKEANCQEVGIGVETLNMQTCKFINRDTDAAIVSNALRVLRRNKIISIAENILGFPGEKEQDIVNLMNFYNQNRPDLITFSWLKLFPSTNMVESLRKRNLISDRALEDLISGRDESLSLGGNFAEIKTFKGAACLLVLLPFLDKRIVKFLLKTKLFRYLIFLNPNVLLRILRIGKSSQATLGIMGRKTYDAGTRISMRIYRYFIMKKFKIA